MSYEELEEIIASEIFEKESEIIYYQSIAKLLDLAKKFENDLTKFQLVRYQKK